MPVPKRRHSKSRKRKKRTHKKIKQNTLVKCKHCGRLKQPHKACPHCGYYRGKKVIEIARKKKKEEE
jgi:large subunit ribosomal protein L32